MTAPGSFGILSCGSVGCRARSDVAGSDFHPNRFGPVVQLHRQVTVGLHPAREERVDDRLAGGRTTTGSSSCLPPQWVTTVGPGLKPSTCSASRLR